MLVPPTRLPAARSLLPTGRRSVQRRGEGKIVESHAYACVEPAGDLLGKRFTPLVLDIKACSIDAFGPLEQHPGEEYAYVVEGAVELHTELYTPLLLNVGDSVYFSSSMGHAYIAAATGPCRIICICSEEADKARRDDPHDIMPFVRRAARAA